MIHISNRCYLNVLCNYIFVVAFDNILCSFSIKYCTINDLIQFIFLLKYKLKQINNDFLIKLRYAILLQSGIFHMDFEYKISSSPRYFFDETTRWRL